MRSDFYEDPRFCERCDEYVRYLLSPERSYCAECGARVKLFSREDQTGFRRSVARDQAHARKRWRPASRSFPEAG